MTDASSSPPVVDDFAARAADLERRIVEIEASARTRLIRAELKTEAVRAGMVDLDGLKLIDTDKLELTNAGDLADAVGVMRNLKREKPWLFGGVSTSSSAVAPPSHPPAQKLATAMTDAEWRAARADLLKRR
jgi:hypothetical protein